MRSCLLSPLALFLLLPHPARALQLRVERPEICAQAALVVLAEVTGQEARWTAAPAGGIETRSDLAVARILKGRPPDDLVVAAAGGTIGELTQTVEDVAALQLDRRYLLMLVPVAADDAYRVLGGEQGSIALGGDDPGPGETEQAALASLGDCLARR